MSRKWLLIGASLGLVLAATITSCDKSPAAPTPPQTPTATRLEISGPRAIVPGVPTQFTATANMSDGTSRDVTTSTSWRIMPVYGRIDVSAPGLLTARENGFADLSAAYTGLTSTREVIAVPEGTFRLTGIVTDVIPPAGPVNGARVTGGSLSTFTGSDGRYVLLGVAGDIELRVTKDRYRPLAQRVVVTDHQTLNVDLQIDGQLPDVSGSYTLTIAAADTCSTALPEEAMSRTYSAIVKQVGPDVRIEVGGARFAKMGGGRTANVIRFARLWPDNVQFELGEAGCFDPDFYYPICLGPEVVEELAPTRFYLQSGFVVLSISPTALSGKLDGEIGIYSRSAFSEPFSRETSCRSSRHRFTFSK